jgi:hypothetical protein
LIAASPEVESSAGIITVVVRCVVPRHSSVACVFDVDRGGAPAPVAEKPPSVELGRSEFMPD